MAVTASQLVAKIEVQGDTAAKSKLSSMGAAVDDTGAKMKGGLLSSIKSTAGGLLDFGSKVGLGIIGIKGIADAAIGFGSALLAPNASMEQTTAGFETLLGKGKATQDMMKQLQDFAAATPFEFPELATDAQHMLAFGFSAKEVIPTLTNIGDAMSAMGKGSADIDRVVAVFGQMKAAGKANAGDMMQLADQGIPAWKFLAEAMHKTIPEVQDLSSKGLIPAKVAIDALTGGMHKMFGGGMAAQANTFNGLMSTLQDNAGAALRAFTGPLFETAKAGLLQLGNTVSGAGFQQFASGAGKAIGDVFASIGQFFSHIDPNALKALETAFVSLGNTLATVLAPVIKPVTDAIISMFSGNATSNAQQFTGAISGLASIINGVNTVVQFMAGLWSAIFPILQAVGAFLISTFTPVWQQLVQVWKTQLQPAFRDLWTALQPAMPAFQLLGVIIGGIVVTALVLLVGVLAGVIKGLAGLLSGLAVAIGGVIQIFSGLVQFLSGWAALIYHLLTGQFSLLSGDLGTIWNGIVTMFTGVWNVIKGLFQAAIGLVVGLITGFGATVIQIFTNLYNQLVGHSIVPVMINGIVALFKSLPTLVIAILNSFITSVVTSFTNLKNQATTQANAIINGIKGAFTALPGMASKWMSDFGNNLVSGLKNTLAQVQQAAQSVAGAISGALGHSVPETGPMADELNWMPHFGDNLARGLRAQMSKLSQASGEVAGSIAGNLQPGGGVLPSGMSAIASSIGASPNIIVNMPPSEIYLDGNRLTSAQLPYIIDAIRNGTGARI